MLMLEARNLCYTKASRMLIQQVNCHVKQQELVVLIGPNGAGKSTLLRLLAGYLSPTQGNCYLQGKDLTQWKASSLAKTRAVMRQQQQLFFPYRVDEIIMMGCSHHIKQHRNQIMEIVLTITECQPLAQRYYSQLSGGEQQRVQLARVLAQLWQSEAAPRCLFLDEPTSALDLSYQQQLFRLLKKLVKETKLSVLCILHDLNLAALYADRVFLLHQGKIVAQGEAEVVLTQSHLQQCYHAELQVIQPIAARPQIFLCP